MSGSDGGEAVLTPQEGWESIHGTMHRARSLMYLAGSSRILLLWGGLTPLMYLAEYWLQTGGSDLAEESPWVRAPIFGVLVVAGIIGSGFIGKRAGLRNATKEVSRAIGIRVFCFWTAVTVAAWLIPGAAGMWNPESGPQVHHVAIGIVTLGFVLFGTMTNFVLAGVGVGIAAAYYVPNYLAGDAALVYSALATMMVVVAGALLIRKSGAE